MYSIMNFQTHLLFNPLTPKSDKNKNLFKKNLKINFVKY